MSWYVMPRMPWTARSSASSAVHDAFPSRYEEVSMSPKKGLTDEERGAMKARLQELKAGEADGESAVLAKIAEMAEPDRALGERLHAIIKASAPVLVPRLWYGM